MKNSVLAVVMVLTFGVLIVPARSSPQGPSVVITQSDQAVMKRILEDWREHQNKVGYSSLTEPYFDCDAHRQLLEYGLKAVPYLIDQRARQHAVEPYIGSALIDDPNIRTLEQVYGYNRRRKDEVYDQTLAKWIVTGTLWESVSPSVSDKEKVTAHIEPIDWFDWWHQHKARFVRPGGNTPAIVVPHRMLRSVPHITTSIKNGLLDFSAAGATYRQMIEHAAAEMGIETFIGEHAYMDIIGLVRMKSVTYEEFLYMVGRSVCVLGFDYRKTAGGYWVGGDQPAKPRAIFKGWGIMMDRTVFTEGQDIPVTVIIRDSHAMVDPCDPAFTSYAGFRVTTNNATVVKDFEPETDRPAAKSVLTARGDMKVDLSLNRFCKLGPGEYNIRFHYLEHQTPSMPIEIYPSDSKTARQLRVTNSEISERDKK
ncbi:MAG: hypothetical protein ACYTEQ_25325 [Planctomycetota bacterium]|jgi:hypothetical protein